MCRKAVEVEKVKSAVVGLLRVLQRREQDPKNAEDIGRLISVVESFV